MSHLPIESAVDAALGAPLAGAPLVSVVVPVFEAGARLSELLVALEAQDFSHDAFECVLVDNSETATLRAPFQPSFALRIVHEPLRGSYAARNRGVRAASGRILAFTDADCQPSPDWLSAAVRELRSGERVLAGNIELFSPHPAMTAFAWHNMVNDMLQAAHVGDDSFGATANLIVPRAIFEAVGPFDSSLFSNGDREWCHRAAARRHRIDFVPSIVVRHPARASWSELEAKARRIAGGRYALASRQGSPLSQSLWLTLRYGREALFRSVTDPRLRADRLWLKVTAIELGLRSVQLAELVRLALGATPRRS